MRGVSPSEIEAAVGELNSIYGADGAPYCIEQTRAAIGWCSAMSSKRMRDKFYGRVKEARLSPAVLEVLSVLAYNQPATAEHLSEVRGAPCGRGIIDTCPAAVGKTSIGQAMAANRRSIRRPIGFLKLFGLDSFRGAARAEELEKA